MKSEEHPSSDPARLRERKIIKTSVLRLGPFLDPFPFVVSSVLSQPLHRAGLLGNNRQPVIHMISCSSDFSTSINFQG